MRNFTCVDDIGDLKTASKRQRMSRESVCRSATRKKQNVVDDFLQLQSPYQQAPNRFQSRHERCYSISTRTWKWKPKEAW